MTKTPELDRLFNALTGQDLAPAPVSEEVREYAELTAEKRRLTADLEDIKKKLSTLEQHLLDRFGAEGVSQMRVDTDEGSFTVFPKRQIWAGIEEGQKLAAIDVLEKLGLKDLLSPNYQSLSSWVREHEEMGVPLPEEFAGVIAVREVFSLAVRKAK